MYRQSPNAYVHSYACVYRFIFSLFIALSTLPLLICMYRLVCLCLTATFSTLLSKIQF